MPAACCCSSASRVRQPRPQPAAARSPWPSWAGCAERPRRWPDLPPANTEPLPRAAPPSRLPPISTRVPFSKLPQQFFFYLNLSFQSILNNRVAFTKLFFNLTNCPFFNQCGKLLFFLASHSHLHFSQCTKHARFFLNWNLFSLPSFYDRRDADVYFTVRWVTSRFCHPFWNTKRIWNKKCVKPF